LLAGQGQPPRLRTVLPNGAAILVEPMPSRSVSIQLWASSRGVEERPETHGLRHLLEHVLALGPDRDLDRRLESKGGFLRARTFRDATQVEITVPADQLDLGFTALGEVLKPLRVSPEQLSKEVKIIDQELGLLDDDALLNEAAWTKGFGQTALDPFGDLEMMRAATPEDVESIRKKQFAASNLVVVVVGPVNLDGATAMARSVVGSLPKVAASPMRDRMWGMPGPAEVDAYGEARAAIVPEFASSKTVGALAAALAIASKLEDCYVTYTPSTKNGLVILGRTDAKQGLGVYVDGLDPSAVAGLLLRGKSLAASWVQQKLRTPAGVGYLRGLLLSQGIENRPEMMLDAIQALDYKAFAAGVQALKKGTAVEVVGTR
jgi:hypothetical protein